MKTTTTIEEILRSEYDKFGGDDFFNPKTGQLLEMGDKFALIKRISYFDDDIYKLCNYALFTDYVLDSKECDRYFKRMFVNHFLNREIAFQTIDLFRVKLLACLMADNKYLSNIYDHFNDIFQGGNNSQDEQTQETDGKNKNANQTLPQDNASIDLTKFEDDFPYADTVNADHSNQKVVTRGTHATQSFNVNVANELEKVFNMELDRLDLKLFLQIW